MRASLYLFALLLLFFTVTGTATAQNPADAVAEMDYYLPDNVTYNEAIPTPEDVLGMVPGEWHVRHDQLVQYMRALAEASDRVTLTQYGRSYEERPLVYVTITTPDNHQNIEQIRQNHVALTNADESGKLDTATMPIVFYMGYSIHGNESSGSNASMLAAYHFAAAEGDGFEQRLQNAVILLDPSFNPDGLGRFAHWANMYKGKNVNADPNNMEQNEAWPGGRTNHYWFDLNRDWMLVQHPESQGRISNFYNWRPNILTDHHEMGTNASFFFQPGIQSRTNPLTPDKNQLLTKRIAQYHADILDQNKRLYYSQESFDDFYYGKGSTYPDINGSIGILFEQGSSRGHAQESINGVLRFPFTIKNQFLTSLSTFKAGTDLRTDILNYQRNFFQNAAQEAGDAEVEGYVYGAENDQGRTTKFTELLRRHHIEVYELAEELQANEHTFRPGSAYIIPANQKQQRMVQALFQRTTTFTDSLFYDVSAWTMPYAFNLPFAELEDSFSTDLQGARVEGIPQSPPAGAVIGGQSDYAYIFEWDEYYAPRALNTMLKNGIRARVAAKPFAAMAGGQQRSFDYGTIMVPVGPQKTEEDRIFSLMQQAAQADGLTVYAVESGLTPSGIDFGSRTFADVQKPNVAIISGEGTSSYEVGEAWHLLDQRFDMTPTLLTADALGAADLSRYNVLVMTSGWVDFSEGDVAKIKRWLQRGNTLITTRYGTRWTAQAGLANLSFAGARADTTAETITQPYADMDAARGAQYIGGAIFNATLDLTNPLGYGFDDEAIHLFRSSTMFVEKSDNPYATPLVYTNEPLAAGYISEENLAQLGGTAGIVVSGVGSGNVISFVDNPNFRAFWYGTNKLFMNAIFFGQTISGGAAN